MRRLLVISPNDKGGQLWNMPPLVKELVAPLTPIQFNARFCLRTPLVHTLSFGMTELDHVREMQGIMPVSVPLAAADQAALMRMAARMAADPYAAYDGYEFENDPSGINIPEVLRFRRLLKCYDMESFGRYRFNMLEPGDEWIWGAPCTAKISTACGTTVPRPVSHFVACSKKRTRRSQSETLQ